MNALIRILAKSGLLTKDLDPVAGFPAMAGNVPFLMKDVVLLAASIYLLKQDVVRVLETGPSASLALYQGR
jgi:uncharacterized membrane protein YkgB